MWQEYTGIPLFHEMVHKECAFLFVDNLSSGWLDWLEEKVSTHTDKRIFVFEHCPIENDEFTVGLKDGETRHTWADDDMRRILRLLRNNHNIIWFTGHTHWAFGVAVNDVYNDDGMMGTIVHTPYLNAYQGWEIDVNENATILKGVTFSADGMKYLGDGYDYAIMQNVGDQGEAEIVTEGGTVEAGGETDISVYLTAKPKANQTVFVETDDAISANVSELTFTPDNYSIPQKVTVTGNAVGTGRLVLYSQTKTTVRKVDVVGGSTTINYFNKNKSFANAGNYNESNLIPAKTGDRILSNTLGSQSSNRLAMYDENLNVIGYAQSNVTAIDYTITEENVAYVTVKYRAADGNYADALVVTVNQDLPSEYIAYNAQPVGYVMTNYADSENPTVVNGYYNSAFTEKGSSGINVSNIIPCVYDDVIYSNNNPAGNAYVYLYNNAKTLIERTDWNNAGVTVSNENAAYFSVVYDNTKANLMIMKNQKVPGYYFVGTDVM